ncbi:MAG TPA: DEAD/DEAH box helicase [Thermoplasmata archaeon]|nr:DEAD/DEAH box helicase [Thermoplasmata archaeon]
MGRHAVRPPPAAPPSLEVSDLVPDPDVREILRAQGITRFYPPQAQAVPSVLAGRSTLLACPTASGKSLVAYLALLSAMRRRRTGLYLVPLRALAQEKYDELCAFEPLGLRVGLSMGDVDLPASKLDRLDVLVATSERADGLLRRGAEWLDRLGVVVVDEVHLLRDFERGPTLEVSLTRLRRHHRDLQVVALSATVGNSRELADWLGAEHIASDFRPVPLKLGTYLDGRVLFTDTEVRDLDPPGDGVQRLVRSIVAEGGQAIVFVNSRRGSEQAARGVASVVREMLSPEERTAARSVEEELRLVAEEETEGARRLTELAPQGVAFHNASLSNPERRVIERAFLDRRLKALAATPTLAAGINLPARRVIVRDTTRYDDRLGGQAPIPALEIQQMCGRAGRPRFDSVGEAIVVARSPEDEERIHDEVLTARPEEVTSRLAAEPALRMHLLALVASGEVANDRELTEFFSETFYGRTLPLADLTGKVGGVRNFLESNDLLARGTELRATRFGKLTSDLYLDPLSAIVLRRALERAPIGVRPFPLLAAIAATPDMTPLITRRAEEAELVTRFADEERELLVKPEEEPLRQDLETFLGTIKTAEVLEMWLSETPLLEITERFSIGAGDLHAKAEDAEWLLFALGRIAVAFHPRLARPADDLALRVRYGVREELLDLVRLRGIGRVRARLLYSAGYGDRESLREAPLERLTKVLRSAAVARMVADQIRHPRGGASVAAPTEGEGTPTGPPVAAPSTTRAGRTRHRRLDEFPDGAP